MKAKIVCTYQGSAPLWDDELISALESIGAEFIGGGYEFKTSERDLEFEIGIGVKIAAQRELDAINEDTPGWIKYEEKHTNSTQGESRHPGRRESMKDNHTPELKPCPFCGHTPIIDSYGPDGLIVRCQCGASVGHRRSGSTLRTAWNTRAKSDLLGEALEALRNIIIDSENHLRLDTFIQYNQKAIDEWTAILAKRKGINK